MSKSDDHFAKGFEPHTRFKHFVLETYFETWGRKLLLRPNAGSTVLYVDACAGRGIDDVGNHGSPVLAAKAAAMAAGQVGDMRNEPVRVQVIAIEKDEAHFDALAANLAPFKDKARALKGTLPEHFAEIEREFPNTPTLYFIDPFGLEPLDGRMVRRALAGDRNEVLLLFADQPALRHFGAAVSQQTKPERDLASLRQELTLFPDLVDEEARQLQPKVARAKKAQAISRENAILILDRAFGGHAWFDVISALPKDQRRKAFVRLYAEFLQSCGAVRVLAFPVLGDDGAHHYHLLHASKSPKGYATMKESIEYALTHGPLGPAVAEIVRAEMRCDPNAVEALVRWRFGGAGRVRWAEDPNDRHAPCVKNFALEDTPMMPSQLEDLKLLLAKSRVPHTRNTILYDIPADAGGP